VDALLAVPDPLVFNSQTAANILAAAYRRRIPLIGFSPAYTRAGALVSLYSTPDQIGFAAAKYCARRSRPNACRRRNGRATSSSGSIRMWRARWGCLIEKRNSRSSLRQKSHEPRPADPDALAGAAARHPGGRAC
jgi:hypothetical protein